MTLKVVDIYTSMNGKVDYGFFWIRSEGLLLSIIHREQLHGLFFIDHYHSLHNLIRETANW